MTPDQRDSYIEEAAELIYQYLRTVREVSEDEAWSVAEYVVDAVVSRAQREEREACAKAVEACPTDKIGEHWVTDTATAAAAIRERK